MQHSEEKPHKCLMHYAKALEERKKCLCPHCPFEAINERSLEVHIRIQLSIQLDEHIQTVHVDRHKDDVLYTRNLSPIPTFVPENSPKVYVRKREKRRL